MTTSEKWAIGNWTDALTADPAVARDARRLAMPVRYSEIKLQSAATTKYEVILAIRHMWEGSQDQTLNWDKRTQYLPSRARGPIAAALVHRIVGQECARQLCAGRQRRA